MILFYPFIWVTNKAYQPVTYINLPPNIIDNFIFDWIIKNPIDRKITPKGILFCIRKLHGIRPSAITVSTVRTKGGNFKIVVIFYRQNYSKLFSDRDCMLQQFLYFIGLGRSNNIKILWFYTEKHIAHAAAGPVGFVTCIL